MDDNCVLLFVKYPEKGKIKTRLNAGSAGIDEVELYKNFLLDVLSTLDKLKTKFYICFHPIDSEAKFVKWLGKKYLYMPQDGIDLGDRMKNCFMKAFSKKFKHVIVIGSDAPDLPGEFIKEAFLFLNNHDVVIGPAGDGGYYLLGFNNDTFVPEIFQGITWSTDEVFWKTLVILNKLNLRTCIMPEWNDIDVYEDLTDFVKRNKDSRNNTLNTYFYLSEHKLLPPFNSPLSGG